MSNYIINRINADDSVFTSKAYLDDKLLFNYIEGAKKSENAESAPAAHPRTASAVPPQPYRDGPSAYEIGFPATPGNWPPDVPPETVLIPLLHFPHFTSIRKF